MVESKIATGDAADLVRRGALREAGAPAITPMSADDTGFKLRGLRWYIVGLVFLATLINYIDRLTLSTLAPVITRELNLSATDFAAIATWFLLAYTISQSLSGKLYDRVGTRRGFSISIIIWSLAAAAHAFARGVASLSFFRFMLGLGEAGNWPGAAKAVAEWFPVRERAFGMAIFNSGAAIGSIIALPLIVWLYTNFGWQATFILTASLGLAWLVLWLTFYETPERHKWLTEAERRHILEGQRVEQTTLEVARFVSEQRVAAEHAHTPFVEDIAAVTPEAVPVNAHITQAAVRWRDLLKYRQVWAIVLARFFTDPIWWLYLTWLPLFLNRVHGYDLKQIGLFAWVPFVAADVGSLFGGWISGYLIGRGWSVNGARKTVIGFAACLMPAGILAAYAATPLVALALIGVVLFGFQVWINNVQTLPSDFFPSRAVASVAGLGGTGAGLGAMIFTLMTGRVVDAVGYTLVLVIAGLLAPIGTLVLFALAGNIKTISLTQLDTPTLAQTQT